MAWTKIIKTDGIPLAIGHGNVMDMTEKAEWVCLTICLNAKSIKSLEKKTKNEIISSLRLALAKAHAQHEIQIESGDY